ncbi:hypothetical protein GQ42DRAFT_155862 [Ramicandelaber brevisporus]|nr:hypothetical protein GQ42DRAFT_155862 [Ramicandelaber brevisporus]
MDPAPEYSPTADDTAPFVHGIAEYQLHPSAAVYTVRPVAASDTDAVVEYGIFDSIGRLEYVYRRSASDGSRRLCLAAGRIANESNERQLWSIQQLHESSSSITLVCTKLWEVDAPSTVAVTVKVDSSEGMSIGIEVPLMQIQSGLKHNTTMFAPAHTDDGGAGINLKIATVSSYEHEAWAKFGGLIYCRDKTSNNFVCTTEIEPKYSKTIALKYAKVKLYSEQISVTDPQLAFILLWNVVLFDLLFSTDAPNSILKRQEMIVGLMLAPQIYKRNRSSKSTRPEYAVHGLCSIL